MALAQLDTSLLQFDAVVVEQNYGIDRTDTDEKRGMEQQMMMHMLVEQQLLLAIKKRPVEASEVELLRHLKAVESEKRTAAEWLVRAKIEIIQLETEAKITSERCCVHARATTANESLLVGLCILPNTVLNVCCVECVMC